jgi:hypothetical protein
MFRTQGIFLCCCRVTGFNILPVCSEYLTDGGWHQKLRLPAAGVKRDFGLWKAFAGVLGWGAIKKKRGAACAGKDMGKKAYRFL